MSNRKILGVVLSALLLAAGAALFCHLHSPSHDHGHDGSQGQMQLNAGQKWETDAPLRTGMERIRALVANAPTHDATSMQSLAGGIREQVDYLIQNCKLAPEADATLHVMIAEFLQGADLISKENDPVRGLSVINAALDAYPRYFAHAGWEAGREEGAQPQEQRSPGAQP